MHFFLLRGVPLEAFLFRGISSGVMLLIVQNREEDKAINTNQNLYQIPLLKDKKLLIQIQLEAFQ
jgi:hypothetical protein